jgi:hypothetical protein
MSERKPITEKMYDEIDTLDHEQVILIVNGDPDTLDPDELRFKEAYDQKHTEKYFPDNETAIISYLDFTMNGIPLLLEVKLKDFEY